MKLSVEGEGVGACVASSPATGTLAHLGDAYPVQAEGVCSFCASGGSDLVFDGSILDEMASMMDDDELDSYIALLAPTVVPRIEGLRDQLEGGDMNGLVETAHALTGGAACYGLCALSTVARQIETRAHSESAEALCRMICQAASLVDESLAAVMGWRCRLRAVPPADLPVPLAAEGGVRRPWPRWGLEAARVR